MIERFDCIDRISGARNVDAFLNQRILPAVSRELLARIAGGKLPAEIRLSTSDDQSLVIDFMDRRDTPAGKSVTRADPVAAAI